MKSSRSVSASAVADNTASSRTQQPFPTVPVLMTGFFPDDGQFSCAALTWAKKSMGISFHEV